MSGTVGIDLRYPLGGLLATLGALLVVYGVMTADNVEMYSRSQGINVNVWWGAVMLVFGLLFLGLAMRASRAERGGSMYRPERETV